MTQMIQRSPDPRCIFCDRRAIAGWLDWEERFTPVCRSHQWIAVAACGSAQAEFINLARTKTPRPEIRPG